MPNTANEVTDTLWHSVVLVYFNSFPDATMCIPMSLRSYDSSLIPIYKIGRVFDNGRFVIFPSAGMGLVLCQPCGKVSTSLANVHFTTRARNSVNSSSTARVMLVFVGVQLRFQLIARPSSLRTNLPS